MYFESNVLNVSAIRDHCADIIWRLKYHLFSNKWTLCWYNFKVSRCGAYWKAVIKRGRRLIQSQINHSQEFQNLVLFSFQIIIMHNYQYSYIIIKLTSKNEKSLCKKPSQKIGALSCLFTYLFIYLFSLYFKLTFPSLQLKPINVN